MMDFATKEEVQDLTLIHYGANKFNPKLILPVTNDFFVKPRGGLWTSPLNSEWGWKDWCHSEDFRTCERENSFLLKFNEGAQVLTVDSYEDIELWPVVDNEMTKFLAHFDYVEIAKHCDAIWLTREGERATRHTRIKTLYGWDCESVLIFNPSSVKEFYEQEKT